MKIYISKKIIIVSSPLMRNQSIEKLAAHLASKKKMVIIPHKNPDGDAMGSTLGLCLYFNNQGHQCTVIAPNAYPDFLKWLPAETAVKQFDADPVSCQKILEEAELIFTLDFNALSRAGQMKDSLTAIRAKGEAKFVMIDHHEEPEDYADFILSVPTAASTCELVYHFIALIKQLDKITPEIATCLYTGIMTDTGSFKFSSTSSNTHRIVAHLLDQGADPAKIHQNIYETKTADQLRLLGIALHNLRVIKQKQTAYITLSQSELDQCNYKKGDTEGIVNYGLSLKGIMFAAIFIEHKQEGIIKISLRSKGDFDVNKVARAYFNGGGHKNAAGGRSLKSLNETVQYFESLVQQNITLGVNAS